MRIALDFDQTYTLDPDCWFDVINTFQEAGHEVVVVTVRHPYWDAHPYIDDLYKQLLVDCIFTDGKAKKAFCEERGINIDVWIDDRPQTILGDSAWNHTHPDLKQWRIDNYAKLLADGYPEYVRDLTDYDEVA